MPNDVVTRGALVLAGLDTGLATYASSGARSLVRLGHVTLPGPALRITEGPVAVAACGEAGCFVIDVLDPTRPAVVGRIRPAGHALDVASREELAFVATSGPSPGACGSLQAYSLADPGAPALLGSLELPGAPRCITLAGDLALVGTGDRVTGAGSGLVVVDASDPSSLVVLAAMPCTLPVNAIAVRGDEAFLATGVVFSGAVESVDLADPLAPRRLGRLTQADAAEGVAVGEDDSLVVAASSLGILRVDVSSPGRMVVLDARPTGRIAVAIAREGGAAVVAERSSIGAGGLTLVAVPASGDLLISSVEPLAEVMDVAQANGLAFVLSRSALSVVDAADPRAPRVLSAWTPVAADFSTMAVTGELAAVGDGTEILLLDVSDPLRPRPRGRVTLRGGVAVDLAFADGTLLVADGRDLEIVDVTDPDLPLVRTTYRPRTWASSVTAVGTLAVVAGGRCLETVDVAASPQLLGRVDVGDVVLAVSLRGGLVAATAQAAGIITIDVADPFAPVVLGRMPGGPGFDVSLEGDRVAIAAGAKGVLMFDVSLPVTPRLVASFDTSGVAQGVALDGDALHVAAEGASHWLLVPSPVPMLDGPSFRESAPVRHPVGSIATRPRIAVRASAEEAIGRR